MDELITTLSVIAMSSPVIVVWMIGVALALFRWRRRPRVSQFTLIACVVMIVVTVVNRIVTLWMPLMARERGWEGDQIRQISIAIGFFYTLISAAAWTMLLCAVFGWRDVGRKKDFPPPPPISANESREQNTTL